MKAKQLALTENEMLERIWECVKTFFPEDGVWHSTCFKKSKELNKNNLPCNLQDTEWLAKMLGHESGCSDVVTLWQVVNLPEFQAKVHEYELKIVNWQIQFILDNREGSSIPEGFDEFAVFSPDYDIYVRAAVVKTLREINMRSEVIEEGLEKFDYWKERSMKHAYHNTFDNSFDKPIHFNLGMLIGSEKASEYETKYKKEVEKHEKKVAEAIAANPYDEWKSKRIAQYNERHADSVAKYGPQQNKEDEKA